jgi:hypothetical protein
MAIFDKNGGCVAIDNRPEARTPSFFNDQWLTRTKIVVLVDDQWPHNPHFVENSHERPFSIITMANTYEILTKKWSPPEIQECDLWQETYVG